MGWRNFWRGVFALLLVFITWQTLTPDPKDTEAGFALARAIARLLFHNENASDKVAHVLAYLSLGASAALAQFSIAGRKWPVVIALACYGVALEFIQGAGGVRTADPADALANFAGALASFPLVVGLAALARRAKSE